MNVRIVDSKLPLNKQVYLTLRDGILSGRIGTGEKLSPSRLLAEELGVSRNTVLHAYDQLVAEGYAIPRAGSGTFVVETIPEHRQAPRESEKATPIALSDIGRRIQNLPDKMLRRNPRKRVRYDFLYGEPAYADLPLQTWSRLLSKCARQMTEAQLGYGPYEGLSVLRSAVAGYLNRTRGVNCDASQVIIVQGTQEAIDLSARLLVNPGDSVVLEEPHYRGFAKSMLAHGANLISIDTDQDGLIVDSLEGLRDVKLACVTPSHQFPKGGVMPLGRRLTLLDWAKQTGALILEDDYDGEFRYDSRPIASLQSLDQSGAVIYVGTASKVFFPSVRLGWMVVPAQLVEPVIAMKSLTDNNTPGLIQLAFAEFISAGHLQRHIHRVRKRHGVKRQVLMQAVEKHLGNRATLIGSGAGIHVLLKLHTISADQLPVLIHQCAEQQVGVYSSEGYYMTPPTEAELILGYASLTEAQIRTGVKRLAAVVNELQAEKSIS